MDSYWEMPSIVGNKQVDSGPYFKRFATSFQGLIWRKGLTDQ